jgi:hypothetical protein
MMTARPPPGEDSAALEVLHDQCGGRAQRVQRIFFLDYEPGWQRPQPH